MTLTDAELRFLASHERGHLFVPEFARASRGWSQDEWTAPSADSRPAACSTARAH